MLKDTINEKILYCLRIYDGDFQSSKQQVKRELKQFVTSKKEYSSLDELIEGCFSELEGNNIISILPYSEMDEKQRCGADEFDKTYYRINEYRL